MLKVFLIAFLLSVNLYSLDVSVSSSEAKKIAKKIWLNEGAGLDKYLVHWNKGEEFASLGIGHFIWFTKDKPMWFFEAFPAMLEYISKRGANPPRWLMQSEDCFWNSYEAWERAKKSKSPKYRELQNFLSRTKTLQAQFMIYRLGDAYKKVTTFTRDKTENQRIAKNFKSVLYTKNGRISSQGLYLLVDYINFKGDGTLKTARYQGKGWGLLQVLRQMKPHHTHSIQSFAKASRFILERLIQLSPPKRRLSRFRKGWMKRIDTYYK
jgi:hypothetical protein